MRRFAASLVLLGLLVAGPPPAGVAQEAVPARGGTWLERRLESLVPGLRVEGLEGVWRGRPAARRITLSDEKGVWLTLERVALDLAPTALVRGEVRLEELDAAFARVDRLPEPAAAPEPTPPPAPGRGGLLRLPDLPVDVSVDRFEVERLEVGPSVAGQPAAFFLDGMAALRADGLRARLDLRRLDGDGQARADIALAPGAGRLSAEVSAREPPGGIVPTLLGTPGHPFSLELRLAGPAEGATLSLEGALGPDTALSATGEVRATADGNHGVRVQGRARAAAPLLPPDLASIVSPAEFSLDAASATDGPLALRSLRVSVPAGAATAAGTVQPASEALDLRLSLDLAEAGRFEPLLPPGAAWSGARATARLTGTLPEPVVELEATPEGLSTGVAPTDAVLGPSPRLALRAALPGPTLDATLDGRAGKLAVQATLAEPLDATARLSLPHLSVLGPGSEGSLEAVVRAEGSLSDPTVTAAARSDRVEVAGRALEGLELDARVESLFSSPLVRADAEGRLEGMPLSLALLGRPEGEKLRLEEGEARLGPARLSAAGVLDPAAPVFDGTVRLEASDLAPLAELAGLEALAGRLILRAKLAPGSGGAQGFDAELDAPRLAYAGTDGDLRATAEGTPGAFGWTLRGDAAGGAVSGRGRVTAEGGGAWRLRVAALEARAAGETLRLAEPAQVVLGPDGGIEVPGLALALPRGGRARAEGRWGPERADLRVVLSALPLAVAEAFAPGVRPRGTLSGEIRATGPVERPEVRAELRGTGVKAAAEWARGLPVLSFRAEGTLAGGTAQARAEIDAGRAGRLTATTRLPDGFGQAAPLAATLDGGLDLAPLAGPFLSAGANRAAGRLAVALRAEGTVGAPRLGGRATLSGGEFRNLEHGVRVSGIEGVVVGEGTRLVVERLRGRTPGNGAIALRGGLDVGAPGLPADLVLTATDARPVASDLVSATLGADLRLTGPVLGGGGTLAGEVRVRRAELRVPERLPASVPTLEGVREVGTPPNGVEPEPPPPPADAAASPMPPLNLAVRVSAPSRVFVRGRGLAVELGGELSIGGTASSPVPRGELELRRGTLDILARRLTFDRGTIDFAAGTPVPRLDLAATTRAGQTVITVTVRGPATSPEIAFSSVPELPQDEILARLLFDRGTGELSALEVAQLAAAAAELTGVGGGAGGILDRARDAFGLDRLGLSGGAAGTTGPALEAGRYVAPGVFVGVRQGARGRTGVEVEVELTERLKLEAQTATGPAGDRIGLAYELEY